MFKIIKSRKYKYYKTLLEGFGDETVSSGFYSNNFQEMYNTAKPREFGNIIIRKGLTGYYEIITGYKIPIIIYKRKKDNSTVLITPSQAYRAKNLIPVENVYIENYVRQNDNDEFREKLIHFIEESNHNKLKKRELTNRK